MPMRWRAWLMSVLGSSRSTPSTTTLPDEGSSRRLRQRSSVDLPEPEGPMTNTSSRSATARPTPFRTWRAPKCLWRPRASTTNSTPRLLTTLQVMRGRVVARHAGHAVARRDHALERIGTRLLAEPFLRHPGDGAVLLHAVEHVLHLVAQRHALLGERRAPVRARVGELQVGDELLVLARGVDDGGVAAERG